MKSISKRIKMIRVDKGMTQTQLAKKLNCGSSKVCDWENGKRGISLKNFFKLAKVLGVSTEDLNPEREFSIKC